MQAYKDAGVDIEKADQLLSTLSRRFRLTHNGQVKHHPSGYAALFDQGHQYLVACTDGIGTKVQLAKELGYYGSLGQDLVAMVINDMICVGAKPLFFLDYLGTDQLKIREHRELLEGLTQTCMEFNIPLIGGETAEMPGVYHQNEVELVGFAVGEVKKSQCVWGDQVRSGDTLWALPSSGLHSNGYGLARKLFRHADKDFKRLMLTPTKIYLNEVQSLLSACPSDIQAMANITGGGVKNILRVTKGLGIDLDTPKWTKSDPLFSALAQKLNHQNKDLYLTFNMGIGFVMISRSPSFDQQLTSLGIDHFKLGQVTDRHQGIILDSEHIY
jgi:phosphoribosylformylglycinamidine cyclo-ligase